MNYKIIISDAYKKRVTKFLKKHPDMFKRYAKAMSILEVDPFHPSLRLHKLKGNLNEYYSVSINMEYRVVIDFLIVDKEIIPIDIGSHDDVY
ncbi:type II toxin-antitoxin system RelE/ParE family toxin [Sulfurovum sp.]|jgi:mRNA-degrading endonuclease YafQ of YafQ-DinJ toxin-antitoxin module|uniref:type II toxin-antitoxin system RelE/ParE family toxin n=1 Tax=Sulfurovum sp. TaxID=1969726 RepID=UPI002A36EA91|nr:type II toxin-antitoxin system RelE/ParE family toxin [Sulfurovum sp.]MDY0402766.1 type II toxin-antitoxin system RelE/ParE family toxin [Sulfurovum sp.]